jgi:transposase
MVAAVRRGRSLRAVARRFGVGVRTAASWVGRATGRRPHRVDGRDRCRAPKRTRRTDTTTEDLALRVRRERRLTSGRGAFGARAVQRALREHGPSDIPSGRTMDRAVT